MSAINLLLNASESVPLSCLIYLQQSIDQAITVPINQDKDATKQEQKQFDDETVLILLRMMSKAGYGNRTQQKKSLKDVFSEATRLAYI